MPEMYSAPRDQKTDELDIIKKLADRCEVDPSAYGESIGKIVEITVDDPAVRHSLIYSLRKEILARGVEKARIRMS